jgi:hypothetical protein
VKQGQIRRSFQMVMGCRRILKIKLGWAAAAVGVRQVHQPSFLGYLFFFFSQVLRYLLISWF